MSSSSSSSSSSSANTKMKSAMGKLKAAGVIANKGSERVKVVVRCRPLNSKEKDAGHKGVVRMDTTMGQISIVNPNKIQDPPKTFTFDSVYDWNATQRGIYDDCAAPIVDSVLEGYNGTIFAYGQTGTGKTHTMEGEPKPEELRGIIPNAFDHIFSAISGEDANMEFLVHASYLEIYNDDIRDLLSSSQDTNLDLKEDKDKGVFVRGLSSKVVKDVHQIDQVMQYGKKNRTTGATEMNARSSRSHSIFIITVETSQNDEEGNNHIRAGKLNLVDLAGSERQAKTKASGDRLKEGCAINLSLSALGNVIGALVDGKTSYIPYRDSKLTRLLQDSLGGNSKTVMVANIGPADYNFDETISTLRYANRAKSIKNKPKINEDPKDAMLRALQEEIERLRAQVDGSGGVGMDGVGQQMVMGPGGERVVVKMDTETMERMKKELDQEKKALLEEKDMAESEKEKIRNELLEREKQLEEERQRKEDTENKLKALEAKLIVGGENLVEKTKQQEMELRKRERELQEKHKMEARLKAQMEEQQAETLNLKEQYGSIQEEVEEKTRRLTKLFNKYKAAKAEIVDLEQEFQVEKADMLETIRELTRDLKLRMLIIDNFIPYEEQKKIEDRAEWDPEHGEWRVAHIAQAGNNLDEEAPRRPISAAGLRRPMSEFSRICSMLPQNPPRFKYENVMDVELEYPERTTTDYEAVSLEDQRVQAALDSAFQEEEEVTFSAMDNLPSMFLSYNGDKGGGGGGGASSGRPKTAGKNRSRGRGGY